MIVKKFIVNDMQEGMLLIRSTMGRDAMILSQRSIRGSGIFGLMKKKRLEVYAAAEEEDVEALRQEPRATRSETVKLNPVQPNERKAALPVNQRAESARSDQQQGKTPTGQPAQPDQNLPQSAGPLSSGQRTRQPVNSQSRQQSQERLDQLTSLIEQMQKQSQMHDAPPTRQTQAAAVNAQQPETEKQGLAPASDQHTHTPRSRPSPINSMGDRGLRESNAKPDTMNRTDDMESMLRDIQRAGVQEQPREIQRAGVQEQDLQKDYQDEADALSGFRPDPLPGQQETQRTSSIGLSAYPTQKDKYSQIRQKSMLKSGTRVPQTSDETKPDLHQSDNELIVDEADQLDVMYEKLLAADVHLQVANHLVNQAADAMQVYDLSAGQILSELIADCFSQDGLELKLKKGRQKKVMFTGPAGVGKTSTLIKLAAQLCREQKLDIGIISADYQRAAAHFQTQAYADILGLSVCCLKSLSEASVTKQEMAEKDLVLIDTPGCNPVFDEQATLVHQLMEIFSPDQLYVCLAAGSSYSMASPLLRFFRDLGDFDLLITKMDEIEACGTLLNFSWLAEKPIACLTDSPFVSEQLRYPDVDAIINRIMR